MGAVAFLATALYWPGVIAPVTTPRWALIALVVPWLLRECRLTAGHVAGIALFAWAAATILWDAAPLDGAGALLIALMLGCCFWLGSQIADLRPLYIGAACGLALSSVVAIIQYFGYAPFPVMTVISGLFVNGNLMAEAAALIAVAVVAERMWGLLPLVLPALVLPHARGALLACAVALAVHYRAELRRYWPTVAAVAVSIGALLFMNGGPSGDERLLIWRSAASGVTIFGHGLGSFWIVFPAYDIRPVVTGLPEYAHNEWLNVAFELGVVGLLLFCVFCASLAGPLDTARLVLIALAVEAFFAFPLHEPTTGFLGMVVAGHAVRNRYLLRDIAGRGRGVGRAWLARAGL